MGKKIVVAIPHSHTWFWSQVCAECLRRNPPRVEGYNVEVVFVDNSPWSPSWRGIQLMYPEFRVCGNSRTNRFHASALDHVVDRWDFDFLLALETDVMVLRPGWLRWFLEQMRETDYAVGAWHHEQFINPSCTLYRGDVLRRMQDWCAEKEEPELLRWGSRFELSQPVADREPARDYADWFDNNIAWIAGPFAEKRGWPVGTVLKEQPSGQMKGPGWYEPGQQLHHWAVNEGYTYTVCPTLTTTVGNVPVQTMYGPCMVVDAIEYPSGMEHLRRTPEQLHQPDPKRQLEAVELFGNAFAAHLWGGTRALDIIKHDVTCQFVKANTPMWLAREARFWLATVPWDIQARTLELIRKYGWHTTGQGNTVPGGDERDRRAAEYVRACYAEGGVTW